MMVLASTWIALSGCAGYGPETPLADLDDGQRAEVCESAGIQQAVLAECGSPLPVRVAPLDPATCAAVWFPEGCTATVAEWQACQAEVASDPCVLQLGHPACEPVQACGTHLWSSALGLDGTRTFAAMTADDIVAVCEASNDYEAFAIECETEIVPFEPIAEICIAFGFGGCGTIGQALDCQDDILTSGEAICDGLPASCGFFDCG